MFCHVPIVWYASSQQSNSQDWAIQRMRTLPPTNSDRSNLLWAQRLPAAGASEPVTVSVHP